MFGIADLIKEMKRRGLPCASRYGIYKYEALGIIPSPRNPLNNWRIYSKEELEECIKRIKKAIK